jgi:integrase
MRIHKPKFKNRQGEWQQGSVYWVQFSVNGKLFRRTLKTKDKRVAQMRALQMVEREERKAVGLADPFEEHRDRPLREHVQDFEAYLGNRGVSKGHLEDRKLCLKEFLDYTRAKTLAGLDLVEAQRWMGEMAHSGRLSARSINKRLAAIRQFGRWLVRVRRHTHDPFAGLQGRNEATDRRRVRRALTDEEVERLLLVARERAVGRAQRRLSPAFEARLRLVGETRAYLYAFALGTGLRKGELRGITWADVDEERRTLTVRASIAKARKQTELPLRSDLAAALGAHRARVAAAGLGVGPGDRLFPGPLFPTHGTVNADFKAAGLDGEDDQGRICDFHSLRVTMISRLSAAGVHPRTAQALARHSKIELTMRTYTDLRLLDLRAAVESVSNPPPRAKRCQA